MAEFDYSRQTNTQYGSNLGASSVIHASTSASGSSDNDYQGRHIKKKKGGKGKIVLIILILILVAALIGLGIFLVNRYYIPQKAYEEIAKNYTLQQAHAENEDCVAWVQIDDTLIDYPVMWTPDDFEYYLHRNFKKEDSYAGTPFFGLNCKAGDNSMLVHGHHMRVGTMFANLEKFADGEFFDNHLISFEMLDGPHVFQPIIASYVDLTNSSHFRYYDYVGNLSQKNKTELFTKLGATAVQSVSQEELDASVTTTTLMLSTCTYHTAEERMVILAKQIS
ncbi:MAG: class B sortase [Coriobacteriales bacterium]|nr:class B sortase [Coriobacteriales bacterium]